VDDPGGPGTLQRELCIYNELLRVEDHWTSQLQNQQTRIATTLTVNGIMLAFIAGGGFLGYPHLSDLAKALLVASVASLAIGIGYGLAGLWPKTPISEPPYLSVKWLGREALELPEGDLLAQLSESLQPKPNTSTPKETLEKRRLCTRIQLRMIGLSAVLITALLPAAYFTHN
jgi:hypothetical protein